MSKPRRTLISTAAGLAALGVATSAALGQGMMGQEQGTEPGMMRPGMQQMPGQGMGPGMMSGGQGPSMMGPGGMGGQGMMDPEMMRMMMSMMRAHGQMGQGMPGMMGPGMGGQGMMGGPGPGMRVTPSEHLTTDDVSHFLGHFLERHANPRLKVGQVEQVDEDTIVAEIVTVDDSLVQRFTVDRHTGQMAPDSAGQAQPAN